MVISEVMYHPLATSAPDEFVELANLSADTVDLAGWRLADRFSTDDLEGSSMLLEPGGFAVIFEADYDTANGAYAGLLPPGALVLFVDDLSIGNGLANSGDSLFLISPTEGRIDSTGWDRDITPGYSLEKVILDDCFQPNNWRISVQLHGTPGGPNSVAGKAIDLALDSLAWQLALPPRSFDITASLSNRGLEPAGGQLLASDSLVAELAPLAADESRHVTFRWDAPPGQVGQVRLTVRIATTADDYDTANYALEVIVLIAPPPLALVVNEIMYTPLSGESEWVEAVNTTSSIVNLGGWTLGDLSSAAFLPTESLLPGAYVVFTGDSAAIGDLPADVRVVIVPGFPALNNTGDRVALSDPAGTLIDQVDYSGFLFTPSGRSLEKVDPTAPSQAPSSWVVSPAPQGHTAGRPNSVLVSPLEPLISLEPNPLRLNRPSSVLLIRYVAPYPSVNLLVELYDLAGRKLATLFNQGPVPGTGAVTWDARGLDPVRFKTGQYVLLIRARDAASNGLWERMERLVLVR